MCGKKTLAAFNQLDVIKVQNRINDEVNTLGLMKNLLQCKNKIINSKEAHKRATEKKNQTEGSHVFPTCTELRRFWDIEMSWKSRSSNKLKLLIEKLKQTATMNRLRWMKKGQIEKLGKHEDNKYKFSSYFFCKFSCANLSSCISFFSPCLMQQTDVFPLSF